MLRRTMMCRVWPLVMPGSHQLRLGKGVGGLFTPECVGVPVAGRVDESSQQSDSVTLLGRGGWGLSVAGGTSDRTSARSHHGHAGGGEPQLEEEQRVSSVQEESCQNEGGTSQSQTRQSC